MSVLIVGSVALDSVETPYGKVERALGGSATYASCAASLFTKVLMIGVVGSDFPEEHMQFLRSCGIDVTGVQRAEGMTFHWSGYYDTNINQAHTRETQLNVFEHFHPVIPQTHRHTDVVFLANIHPELQLGVLEQVCGPRLVLCDTRDLWIDTARDDLLKVIARVDVLLLNDEEARMLTGTWNLATAGGQLLQMGPDIVIIKKGEHGALVFARTGSGIERFTAPSYPTEAVMDPTGAGDCFAGGLSGYLDAQGDFSLGNFRKAVIYGSVIASYAVESFSIDRLRQVNTDAIVRRYEELKAMTQFE